MAGRFNALFDDAAAVPPLDANALAPRPTWADAYTQTTQAASDWIAQQRAISQQRGLWDEGGITPAGARDVASQVANNLAFATTAPGFKAYHGSPHDFERFDASKIGTGEGNQAYGHGLYVAENEGVARSYRDALKWKGTDWNDPQYVAGFWHNHFGGDADKAVAHLTGALKSQSTPEAKQAVQGAIDRLRSGDVGTGSANPGAMYEVNVNADPAHFLDWDKPISEQSPHVQEAIAKLTKGMKPEEYSLPVNNPDGSIEQGAWGSTVYQGLARKGGARVNNSFGYGDAATSEALREAGIPGIRYLDGGSRASGEGTSNHVIFDANTIEILRKYGIAGLLAGGTAAASLTRQPSEQ